MGWCVLCLNSFGSIWLNRLQLFYRAFLMIKLETLPYPSEPIDAMRIKNERMMLCETLCVSLSLFLFFFLFSFFVSFLSFPCLSFWCLSFCLPLSFSLSLSLSHILSVAKACKPDPTWNRFRYTVGQGHSSAKGSTARDSTRCSWAAWYCLSTVGCACLLP